MRRLKQMLFPALGGCEVRAIQLGQGESLGPPAPHGLHPALQQVPSEHRAQHRLWPAANRTLWSPETMTLQRHRGLFCSRRVACSSETFCKPRWCKRQKPLPSIYTENYVSLLGPPK